MPNAYERIATFEISEILPLIPTEEKVLLAGELVNCKSKRLIQFKNSQFCQTCGLKAQYFALERPKFGNTRSFHLNLYSADGTLFTRDHIIPLCKDGPNSIKNSQTLCWPCNQEKKDN